MKKTDGLLLVLLAIFCSILPARADAMGPEVVLFILALPAIVIAIVVIIIVLIIKHRKKK